ncbi:MAG TPA: hypothetical protein QF753_00235 [Victivallales bacterium]|nr:hypothetical protein [Victivallales bacterium]
MVEFYNISKKSSVLIPEKNCRKISFNIVKEYNMFRRRFTVQAKDNDGSALLKVITKDKYDQLECPSSFLY